MKKLKIGEPEIPKISEDFLQKMVAKYIDTRYHNALFIHCPNGGSRHLLEAVKLKAMGVKSGVPDVLIFDRMQNFNGLAIELKVGKNKISDNQAAMIKRFQCIGWKVVVCYTFEEVKKVLEEYFVP